MFCVSPTTCHSSLLVLHTNGIHEVSILYCDCAHIVPPHIQLLHCGMYPASQLVVKTCATFELLNLLHKLALTTKASNYNFYRAIENLTTNTGLNVPKSRYKALFRMTMQWKHLKLLKQGGRAHDPDGVKVTQSGELAVLCPSCPRPGINLPKGWEDAPPEFKWVQQPFNLKNCQPHIFLDFSICCSFAWMLTWGSGPLHTHGSYESKF